MIINQLNIFFLKISKIIKFFKLNIYNPFSLNSRLKPDRLYSDFFVFNTEYYKTYFIAENIYYLYKKRKLCTTHEFRFFSEKGNLIKNFSQKSESLFSKILLPKINHKSKYISFTHNSFCNKDKNFLKKGLSIQHRGYTIFHKTKKSLGAVLHGNIGGISPKGHNKMAMVQRNKNFIYTPAYKFLINQKYDLVFNNPTNKILKIKIVFNFFNKKFSDKNLAIEINPLGTNYINVSNFEGKISFISKIAICRCCIFKNPGKYSRNFDVLHS